MVLILGLSPIQPPLTGHCAVPCPVRGGGEGRGRAAESHRASQLESEIHRQIQPLRGRLIFDSRRQPTGVLSDMKGNASNLYLEGVR
jgi:hypothetical protein